MLKKLLPISQIWEKLRNLKKNPQPAEQEPLNQSPNLLDISQPYSDSPFKVLKGVGSIQKFILFSQAVFIIVFALHYVLDSKIKTAEQEIADLEIQIRSYGNMITESESLIKRIEKYKSLKSNRVHLAERIRFVLENSKYVSLSTINVTTSQIKLRVTADNPLNFALLLNDYFANKSIKQVILVSAAYGGTSVSGGYSMEMELIY